MTDIKFHTIDGLPRSMSPSSHASEADGFVFLTGQFGRDLDDPDKPLPDGIRAQTDRTMRNLVRVLGALDLTLGNVLSVRVFLTHFKRDYAAMNEVYGGFFIGEGRPVRTCVGVTDLVRDALIESSLRGEALKMEDREIRAALDLHWAASDANDFEVEHRIYRDDAVLEYPQSGERLRGRRNIQASRSAQPSSKRFTVRRILGSGDLWITELVITYDGQPSYVVSIMELSGGKVSRETQYFGDAFEPGPSRAQWVERMR